MPKSKKKQIVGRPISSYFLKNEPPAPLDEILSGKGTNIQNDKIESSLDPLKKALISSTFYLLTADSI